jgi:thiol-disulfide isomerase/thioredoxin
MKNKLLVLILCLCLFNFHPPAFATDATLKTFNSGSYQHLLTWYKDQPFILVIWSMSCLSCLKEMSLIAKLHQQQPKLNLVMLAVDGYSVKAEINEILAKFKLKNLDNWVFAAANSVKLRFEIDPDWYGELPRTYFFNKTHQRTGISGVITEKKYQQMVK